MPELPSPLPWSFGTAAPPTPLPSPEGELSPEWGEGPWPGVHPGSTDQTKPKRPEWLVGIPNFVHWLIEHVLRAIVQAILGIFVHGGLGSAFPHLQQWAQNLEDRFAKLGLAFHSLFGHDPIIGDFPFLEAIHNLIDNLLPAGRLAELFNGRLKDGQEPQSLADMWKNLRDLMRGNDDGTAGDLPGWNWAMQLLHRLAGDANDSAQTGLHLLNFGANQPIWGHTNPTMQVPFGFLHLRKFATNGVTVTTHADPESITVTPTQSGGVFNRWDKSRDVDLISWRGKGNSGVTAMNVHVWRMDTTTGDLTWLQSKNVVPASLPTAAFDMVYVPLATPVHVDTGTVLAAEITTTGGNHSVAGADVPWLTDDLTARPKRQAFTRSVNAGATPPATIADASVAYSTRIPVIALGQAISALPAPKYVYTETFAGSTAAWKALAGSLLFSGSTFRTGTVGNNFALFNYTPYGDDARVEFDLRAEWNLLNQSFNNGDKIRLMMCCSASVSQYVGLEIESNRNIFAGGADHNLRIITGFSPTGTPTVRAAGLLDGSYTGLVGIEYDSATNIFRISVGGAPTTLTWTDSGHVIAHNADSRQAAIYANFSAANQVVCDNFSYRDL